MTFVGEARASEDAERMYATDLKVQGYVANQTRVWAHSPESLAALSYALTTSTQTAGLDVRQRALLVTTSAAAMGDAYCSLAFGYKLANAVGPQAAAQAVAGDDAPLSDLDRALVRWARKVVRRPNETTAEDVEQLRAVGLDDDQIVALTVFVALRQAFSTVNDALGAQPDSELVDRVPAEVRQAVTFGR
ncbi:hypothetical protein ISU10_04520 [Nocardioides agariphilus]|jgi:uncharacterized peroxidase-related enzyme|uniref:Alkylhydroperoxidase family enzyme, contains CxxC motif n=1 Tax=Nocardioides agariphilus TaxID=433664 RepID=A0A930VI27_9ACTN|nr:hypothetical protein [Nocardioides agariphilus]MBF4767027.1 hypothetical protein [Nocardioides agariphilus]